MTGENLDGVSSKLLFSGDKEPGVLVPGVGRQCSLSSSLAPSLRFQIPPKLHGSAYALPACSLDPSLMSPGPMELTFTLCY